MDTLREAIFNLGLFFLVIGVLIILFYFLTSMTKKGSKKYDFINKNEVKYLWYGTLAFATSFFMFTTSIIEGFFKTPFTFEFFFGMFIALVFTNILGWSVYSYLKYFYPSIVEKKVNKIRFKPRVSPETGNPMRLLNEEEEDIHLTEEMIADEDNFAYEYDVWFDDKTGHKFIERYDVHFHALICRKCKFRTLQDYKEEIVKNPTQTEKGTIRKYYECTYCAHKEAMDATIPASGEEEVQFLS